MTLTFYDICLHYEVEHLQNDIESKEPREQTEQITTEYIEYIIAFHCMPLYVFARLCPSFALPSGDTLCIAKILMGQSFPDHPVVMCCLSFKIFKDNPWHPYEIHMTTLHPWYQWGVIPVKPVKTSWNELAKLPQGSSIPNELRDFVEPLLKEIGRHDDERPLAGEILWTARKHENQRVDGHKKQKKWQLLTTQTRIITCFTHLCNLSNFSIGNIEHREHLQLWKQMVNPPTRRSDLGWYKVTTVERRHRGQGLPQRAIDQGNGGRLAIITGD